MATIRPLSNGPVKVATSSAQRPLSGGIISSEAAGVVLTGPSAQITGTTTATICVTVTLPT